MRKIYLLLLLLLPLIGGVAQSVEWNKTYTSSGGDVAPYDAAVHTNNDIFVVGGFRRTSNFGGGYSLTPNSYNGGTNSDGFLLKLDRLGNTKWAKAIATDANPGDALHIEIKGNSLYIASQDANSSFDYYALIEKYDTAGNRIWNKTISNTDSYWVLDMYVDDAENVYLMYLQWQYTYVRKYDSNGNVLYTRTIGSAYTYEPEDIVADAAGNFYITGATSPASYNRGLIVAKFRPDGTNVFNHVYGGTGNQETYGYKIAIDDTANMYITGFFNKSVSLGTNTLTSPDGQLRGYVAKFDSTGVNKWATMINITGSVHTSAGTGYSAIDVDLSNDGQQVYTIYGNSFRRYNMAGVLQNSTSLTAERYFGFGEAPDGSIYLAGESAYTTGYATKIGCGAPSINLPSVIDTLVGATLNLSIPGTGYTVNWYSGNTLLAGNTPNFSLTVNGDTTIRVEVVTSGGCIGSKTITINGICYITRNNPQTICEGTSYQGYTLPGTYRDTVTGTAGCDTIKVLQLTVLDTIHTTVAATICAGQSLGGHSTSGTFTDVLQRANGCDSVRTLVLTVLPVATRNVTTTICFGDSYLGYASAGTYRDTFVAASGCDSIRVLNLTIRPQNTTTITRTICQGDNYEGYTTGGTHVDVFTDQYGCDSTRTLVLTVTNTIRITVTQSVCFGDSYLGYNATGVYLDTFPSATGCDSVRTLNLTVRPNNATTITQSICQGGSFEGYNTNGTFTDVFTDQYGCDSTRTLILSVVGAIQTTVNDSVCDGFSLEGYTLPGTYIDTFTAVGGCDSIRTLNLSVHPLPVVNLGNDTTICQDSMLVLNASVGYASYLWSVGQTTQTITVGAGSYNVSVTNLHGCEGVDEINVISTVCVGIGEVLLADIHVYPNPFADVVYIENPSEGPAYYVLQDLLGKKVSEGNVTSATNRLGLDGLSTGVYLLKIRIGDSERTFKLMH